MSHSTTSGGGRRRGLLRFSSIRPPERSAARIVARRSARRAVPVGGEAAGRHVLHRQAQPRDRGLGARQLVERHLLEIHAAQLLAVGKGHDRVDFGLDLLGLAGRLAAVRVQCLGEPPRHLGAAVLFGLDPQFGQHQPHHLFQQIGVAPEDVKGLVENQPLVRPVDEDRVQCPIEVAPVGDADRPDRIDRVDDLAGPDRQPGRAQGAREMHQIGDEPPGFRLRELALLDIRSARHVMAGLVPAITSCASAAWWMTGSSPVMTENGRDASTSARMSD